VAAPLAWPTLLSHRTQARGWRKVGLRVASGSHSDMRVGYFENMEKDLGLGRCNTAT